MDSKICICTYCKQELHSRGEQFRSFGTVYFDFPAFCDLCGEEDFEMLEIEFDD